MEKLTDEEKIQIAKEMIQEQPLPTIGTVALITLAEMAISTNAKTIELSTDATISGDNYKLHLVVSYKKKK